MGTQRRDPPPHERSSASGAEIDSVDPTKSTIGKSAGRSDFPAELGAWRRPPFEPAIKGLRAGHDDDDADDGVIRQRFRLLLLVPHGDEVGAERV